MITREVADGIPGIGEGIGHPIDLSRTVEEPVDFVDPVNERDDGSPSR
jgi:hypothetical protein